MDSTEDETNADLQKWTVHSMSKPIVPFIHANLPCTTPVEVCLRQKSSSRFETVRGLVHSYVNSFDRIALSSVLDGWQYIPELASSVEKISISESACPLNTLPLQETLIQIHVYQPSDGGTFEEFSNSAGAKDDDDDTMAASISELPNKSWEGLWDSLIYADDIKMKLLDYIHATLVLSDAKVDCECIVMSLYAD